MPEFGMAMVLEDNFWQTDSGRAQLAWNLYQIDKAFRKRFTSWQYKQLTPASYKWQVAPCPSGGSNNPAEKYFGVHVLVSVPEDPAGAKPERSLL